MALYLSYRPKSFADVVGQDHIVSTLEQAVKQRRFGHAYLFSGTRGTGKTSVARILARHMLLDGIDDATLRTHIETAINDGNLVDFIEIDAASNRKIEEMRDLIAKVGFSPTMAKTKVYLIDEVHMLTNESFNALLKTLEEPPEYAYFILATTELHKVPETIQSRCQRFLFRRVKDDDILSRLQYIVDREKIHADRDALRAIARQANGSFRDGIALLDQLQSLPHITAADVTERIGSVADTFVDDLATALNTGNGATIRDTIATMETQNTPLDIVTTGLLGRARTGLHAAIEGGTTIAPWIRMTDTLLDALKGMRSVPVPGLVLEAHLLRFIHHNSNETLSPVKKPAKEVSPVLPITTRSNATAATPIEQTLHVHKEKKEAPKSALVDAEPLTKETLLRHWETILKLVTPASVRMSLKDANIYDVTGRTITLHFGSAFHRDRVATTEASRAIEDVIGTIFRGTVSLQCDLHGKATPATAAPATDLAEAAAEVFGTFS